MRFRDLQIRNFKAVEFAHLADLTDFVLIAGPNGCGKSCILDAIRLLKSVYGGYQANEWEQWFGEFQIDSTNRESFQAIFRDKTKPIEISASLTLRDDEASYLRENLVDIISPIVWSNTAGQARMHRRAGQTGGMKLFTTEILAEANQWAEQVRVAMGNPYDTVRVTITPEGAVQVYDNPVFALIFQIYDPQNIGVLDFHSASRTYQREPVGAIDLNSRSEDQYASQALYNTQARFQQVKTQLAGTYVRELINNDAGAPTSSEPANLNDTVKELFQTFFPDKEYLGVVPKPGGGLEFPVKTASGTHDINELSSGEKEIVYGYLRLRNSAPRNSTILIDEPELHLNPGLLRGMPAFYHKHLGQARQNQLWLVTHSDALLRNTVGIASYSVYHMSPASGRGENQISTVAADDELDSATLSLVGDQATYQPRSKVILFEGGGESEFDVSLTRSLFPDLTKNINLVSSGSKRRARDIFDVLSESAKAAGTPQRFFVVVDRDSDPEFRADPGDHRFTWDRYHIENYLISETHIRVAANDITMRTVFATDDAVTAALRVSAAAIQQAVIAHRLRTVVNSQLTSALNLGKKPPGASDAVTAMMPALIASFSRLRAAEESLISQGNLESMARTISAEVAQSLADDTWRQTFPGRDILRRFVGDHLNGIANYEGFRNLIVSRMVADEYRPAGIEAVIKEIAEAPTS